MRCDDSVKQSVLDSISVGWVAAKATKDRVSALLPVNPAQFANLQTFLGLDPLTADPETFTYLPELWPSFDIVVTSKQGYLDAVRFTRKDGLQAPRISEPEELTAWSVTIAELAEIFGPLEDGDHWPPYEEFLFSTASGDRYGAGFSWGLLQDVEKLASPGGFGSLNL